MTTSASDSLSKRVWTLVSSAVPLAQVDVRADEVTGTADITLCLVDDTWENQARAIDRMVELRGEVLDEWAIGYRFMRAALPPAPPATA